MTKSKYNPFTDCILPAAGKYTEKYHIVDNRVIEVHKVIVHKFRLTDVDDPDLWAAEPLYDWCKSDVGQWILTHALEVPVWRRYTDPSLFYYNYIIEAKLDGKEFTYWNLKWANSVDKLQK